MTKKRVNYRIPLCVSAAFAAGIALGYLARFLNVERCYLFAIIPAAAAIFILIAVCTKNGKAMIVFALAALFLLFGALYSYYELQKYGESSAPSSDCTVCGKVSSLSISGDVRYVVLTDVTFDGVPADGKLRATLTDTAGDLCDEGDTVTFTAEVSACDTFVYGKLNTLAVKGIKYTCTVYSGLEAESGFSLFGEARASVRENLYNNLDSSTAGVAFAMLTGDTGGVEDGVSSAFRYGGIAHIFAVSGLHIGIVYGAALAVCRFLKLRKRSSSVVCLVLIVLYSGVCGFTVSSVRAVIMCFVLQFAHFVGRKYDGLNSLSLAVLLILLINPLDLFSSGFRLSVLSVAGIALYNVRFKKALSFMPFGLGNGLGVSLSAQTGTFPAMLSSFGYVSGAGLLLNFLVLPVLSAIFVLLLAGVLLSIIIYPCASVIICACAAPLEAVTSFLVLYGFEDALVYGLGGALFLPLYYFFAVLLSDKINKSRAQSAAALVLAAVCAALYAFIAAYYPMNGAYICVSGYYNGGYVLFKTSQGTVLVITQDVLNYRLNTFLSGYGAAELDAAIILGDEEAASSYLNMGLNAKRAYICGNYLWSGGVQDVKITAKNAFSECGISFVFVDGYTVTATCSGVKTGICAGESVPEGCDLLVGDDVGGGIYTVNFSSGDGDWCVYRSGDISFSAAYNQLKVNYWW